MMKWWLCLKFLFEKVFLVMFDSLVELPYRFFDILLDPDRDGKGAVYQ